VKTIEKADATASLASYAEHAEDFPIVITDHGRPIAALMPVPNADAETVSLSSNSEFLSLISRIDLAQPSATNERRRNIDERDATAVGRIEEQCRRRVAQTDVCGNPGTSASNVPSTLYSVHRTQGVIFSQACGTR
jgi:antitoxin (DNA-binding transcriptional repressor) of toxin-antitoxin stability system